jgi:hypothetical protein
MSNDGLVENVMGLVLSVQPVPALNALFSAFRSLYSMYKTMCVHQYR